MPQCANISQKFHGPTNTGSKVLSVHTIFNGTLKSVSDLLPLQSHYLFPKNDDNHPRESNREFFDDMTLKPAEA